MAHTRMVVSVAAIALLLLLCTIGMPIGLALCCVSFLGFWYLVGWDIMLAQFEPVFFSAVAQYGFSVIPMFILMGQAGLLQWFADRHIRCGA